VDNIDKFLDQLQEDILDEAKQALGERGFDRWRNLRYNGVGGFRTESKGDLVDPVS